MEVKGLDGSVEKVTKAAPWKHEYIYIIIIAISYLHLSAVYGLYLLFTSAKWQTITWGIFLHWYCCMGIITGAHRLWTHKSYKAKLPLQLLLILAQSMAHQGSVIYWARHHRLHHKYSDTDADPHNSSRGFFFSHIGWILLRKHPEVLKRSKTIDLSDLWNNPILKFQHENRTWMIPLLTFVIPTAIPMHFWGESFTNAHHLNSLRYIIVLNTACMINSVAHLWGFKPIDKNIRPVTNLAAVYLAFGEGLHNYHHVFPFDYKFAEMGYLDFMGRVIDFFAFCGMAYDLKTVKPELIRARAKRTGDGSIEF